MTSPTLNHSQQAQEPMLTDDVSRFIPFPIQYPKLWDFYKQHVASFWTADEIDLYGDVNDWVKLSDDDRYFISHVLAFFVASDGIVMENLALRFMNDVKVPEARMFYSFQNAMEAIHSETYALLLQTYITDETKRNKYLNAIQTIPVIKKKADWAIKWIGSSESFAERLVAFACVEGIFFSGSFCAIFWLKKRGVMNGLVFSNELIARDEGLHRDFACVLYGHLNNKLNPSTVYDIVRSAVEIEKEFVVDALPVNLIGTNADQMSDYIEYVADHLLTTLGLPAHYNTTNPFPWMELVSLPTKHNFFERRVSNYQKAFVMESSHQQQDMFEVTEEF